MIERERHLEPVFRHAPRIEQGAGIVDQHIDLGLGLGNLARNPFHLGKPRQIGVVDRVIRVARDCAQVPARFLASMAVPRHENNAGAALREAVRRDFADAGRGAGDDDDLVSHGPRH